MQKKVPVHLFLAFRAVTTSEEQKKLNKRDPAHRGFPSLYKPVLFSYTIKVFDYMFLFSRFFRLGVSHTPIVGRKQLLHLVEPTL
jgi:hypothetical protein